MLFFILQNAHAGNFNEPKGESQEYRQCQAQKRSTTYYGIDLLILASNSFRVQSSNMQSAEMKQTRFYLISLISFQTYGTKLVIKLSVTKEI